MKRDRSISTVIKASENTKHIRPVAFNFNDMVGQAETRLNDFRQEAAGLIAQAKKESEAIRKKAQQEGRDALQKQVRHQLVAEQTQQLATLMPALKKVVEEVQHARLAWISHWEKTAVQVAIDIAERIIRREVENRPEITLNWVREALELAVGNDQIQVRLSPQDCQTLGEDVQMVIAQIQSLAPVEVVADPEITPGGCRIDTQFGSIDQQVQAQLARVYEELTEV